MHKRFLHFNTSKVDDTHFLQFHCYLQILHPDAMTFEVIAWIICSYSNASTSAADHLAGYVAQTKL